MLWVKGCKRPKKWRGKRFLVNLIFHFISARNAAGFSCESSIKLGVCEPGGGVCVRVGMGVQVCVCGCVHVVSIYCLGRGRCHAPVLASKTAVGAHFWQV